MLEAIAGDVIGSVHEWEATKTPHFDPLIAEDATFTDDSVLTCAVAAALLDGGVGNANYTERLRTFARRYPRAGYGGNFRRWFRSDDAGPYESWGNGSAMWVSPVGWACETADDVLAESRRSAVVTHSHPEGVKGARTTALAVFRARTGATKDDIRTEIADRFAYDLSRTLAEIRPRYCFDVSCAGSVPEALIAFLEADDYESAVRNAVSLGGDADTQAAIAGAVAQAFHGGVPAAVAAPVLARLPADLRAVWEAFAERYAVPGGPGDPLFRQAADREKG